MKDSINCAVRVGGTEQRMDLELKRDEGGNPYAVVGTNPDDSAITCALNREHIARDPQGRAHHFHYRGEILVRLGNPTHAFADTAEKLVRLA